MRSDSSFCVKSVRYTIFTNGAPYKALKDAPSKEPSNLHVRTARF